MFGVPKIGRYPYISSIFMGFSLTKNHPFRGNFETSQKTRCCELSSRYSQHRRPGQVVVPQGCASTFAWGPTIQFVHRAMVLKTAMSLQITKLWKPWKYVGIPMVFPMVFPCGETPNSTNFPIVFHGFFQELLETLCIRLRNDGELLEASTNMAG